MRKREELIRHFEEVYEAFEKSFGRLEKAREKCIALGIKPEYTDEELESFESLASRFARTSDLLTQKLLRTFYMLIYERPSTTIDAANLLEKLKLVRDGDDFIIIRQLRNKISHEYVEDDLPELFESIIGYAPQIATIASKTRDYVKKIEKK
ncbi:MAG: hypothetical protein ACM3U1_01845 [Chloroflexota bacterium]